jgi:hypothetical protein
MGADRDHHPHVDPLQKARRDIENVFDLFDRFRRGINSVLSPFRGDPHEAPSRPSAPPTTKVEVDGRVVDPSAPGGIKVVVRDETKPIKRGG